MNRFGCLATALIGSALLACCDSGQSASIPTTAEPAGSISGAASPSSQLTTPPSSSAAPTTSSISPMAPTTPSPTAISTTLPPAVTEPSVIRRRGAFEDGVEIARDLADAFVQNDWTTVRELSPTNRYTDDELTTGYAGLVDQELVLAGQRSIDSQTVALYFMLFADEQRPGPQTSTYCVRWDVHSDTGTIVQQLGTMLDRTEGSFSRDSLGAAWVCGELGSGSELDPGPGTPGGDLIGPEIDDPGVISYKGGTYECEPPPHMLGVARSCRSAGTSANSEPTVLCSVADASGTLWDCTDEGYYPDELDGYSVATIEDRRALCDQESGDCWIWDEYEVPSEAVFFDPDYRCVNDLCERT